MPYPFTREQMIKDIKSWRAAKWNREHPERVRERARLYYQANKVKCLAANDKWRRNNLKKANQRVREYVARNPWVNSYQAARARCLKRDNPRWKRYGGRGIKFMLTMDDCKALWIRDNASSLMMPTIDRIDNDGDYQVSNCQFISRSDNSKKANIDRARRAAKAGSGKGSSVVGLC